MTLQALEHTEVPARIWNLAGPRVRVRDIVEQLGAAFGVPVTFSEDEGRNALLSDGTASYASLGAPQVEVDQMLRWTVDWILRGRRDAGQTHSFSEPSRPVLSRRSVALA